MWELEEVKVSCSILDGLMELKRALRQHSKEGAAAVWIGDD